MQIFPSLRDRLLLHCDIVAKHVKMVVEDKSRFAQLANFEREHLEIPAEVERQLVVGEHIGAALRRREVRQDDAR